MAFDENEISKNSQGGTERMKRGLEQRLPEGLADDFQIICSRVRELDDSKIRVYWLHDLPEDPETNHLNSQESRDRFHRIVFCGNWQAQRYRDMLAFPHDDRSLVLETAIDPIEAIEKPKDVIRLVYTSTPQRGLEILVPVFEELCKKYDNIELDVYSSFKIYGWEDKDKEYEKLYERCRNHPKINYHGFVQHEEIVKALQKSHILAYPSIWLECNSQSVIEAMSAKVLAVHPNNGGLMDTSGGMNFIYNWVPDLNEHARKFYQVLDHAIQTVQKEETQNYLSLIKVYADTRFNWKKITAQWVDLLQGLKAQYPDVSARKTIKRKQFFHYVVK